MKVLPYIYVFYCFSGIVCTLFDVEGARLLSDINLKYWALNITIIVTLLKPTKLNWYLLLIILLVTLPIVWNYESNRPYEYIGFTMSPVFQLPNYVLPRQLFYMTGLILQISLIGWMFLKDVRVRYKISNTSDTGIN